MASGPKRVVRNCANPWFPTTFRQAKLKMNALLEPKEKLETVLESFTEAVRPNRPWNQVLHWLSTYLYPIRHPHWKYETQWENGSKGSKSHLCGTVFGPSMQKVAKEGTSDVFFVRFEEASNQFENTPKYCVEGVHTYMTAKDFL